MNDLAIKQTSALALSNDELIRVLQSSLYPGAKDDSVKMVLGYCQAAGLDPLQKPVHIVPISVKQGDSYAMRDVVMPGIGLYRTQASRTGEYAGVTEPEFGPSKQLKSGEFVMEYPEWCRVTVKRRMESGEIVEFTANERWLENYATQKRDTIMPNAMWKRRPFAQLAKCAEAQALRKAFPELGAAPTADEMEGKQLDDTAAYQPPPIEQPRGKNDPKPEHKQDVSDAVVVDKSDEPKDDRPMQAGQKRILTAKLKNAALNDVDLKAVFGRALEDEGWLFSDFDKVQKFITERSGGQ